MATTFLREGAANNIGFRLSRRAKPRTAMKSRVSKENPLKVKAHGAAPKRKLATKSA
jgi:hypothetical protein